MIGNSNTLHIEIELGKDGAVKGFRQVGAESEKAFSKTDSASQKAGGAVRRAFSKMTDGAKGLLSRVGKLAKTFAKMTAAAGVAAVGAIGGIIKASVGQFAEFESAMVDLGKVTAEPLADVQKKIMGMDAALGGSTEMVRAYYQVVSAGVTDPKEAMEVLEASAKTAKAAHVDQAETIKGLTSLMDAYAGQIGGVTEASDLLFQIEAKGKTTVAELIPEIGTLASASAELNIHYDDMGAALAQITKYAGSTSQAATQYKSILSGLIKPTKDMSSLLEEYGGAQEAIKNLGFDGVMKLIADATDGNAEALGKLFGDREAMLGFFALAKNGFGDLNQKMEEMDEKTGITEQAWAKYKETLSGLWTTFKNTIGKQAIMLGEKLAPKIKEVIQDVSGWIEKNQDLIESKIIDFAEGFATTIDKIREGIKNLIPIMKKAWEVAKSLATGLYKVGEWIGVIDSGEETVTAPAAAPVQDSYAVGTDYVPKTGLYRLHQGEAVIPAHENLAGRGNSRGVTVQGDINIVIPENAAPQGPEDYRRITRDIILPELEALGRA